MNDRSPFTDKARRLLDEELQQRRPGLQPELDRRRRAAISTADDKHVGTTPAWWMAGAATCALAVALVLPLQPPAPVVEKEVAASEVIEVLDNLELLLFFEDDGIDLDDAPLEDELG